MSTSVRTILVPIDGSALSLQAIGLAAHLAGDSGTLHLVRVLPAHPTDFSLRIRRSQAMDSRIRQLEQDDALASLTGAAAGLANTHIETHVLEGDPADQILRIAQHVGADLIVMSTHGRGALSRIWYGSITDRVVRESTVPVTVIRAQGVFDPPIPTRIVFATDGSELAQRALPALVMLSKTLQVPVHVVTVIDPVGDLSAMTGGAVFVSKTLFEETEVDIAEAARAALYATREALEREGIAVTIELLEGNNTAKLIAAIQPTDLAVMTSHGRGGITRWAIGSVAERVVRSARGAVTIVPNVVATVAQSLPAPHVVTVPLTTGEAPTGR